MAVRRSVAAVLALTAGLVAILATGGRAEAVETTCPATFQVLHDDRVGKLRLAAGHYEIVILDSGQPSCHHASDLLRQFLEDFDGKLRGRWVVVPSESEFRRGRNSTVGFRLVATDTPSGGGGGGRHPATGTACPGFFDVLHNDRIGKLRLRKGEYRITTLAARAKPSCKRAAKLFGQFLRDWDGKLPRPWRLDLKTATFSKSLHVGFRVKRAVGEEPSPGTGGRHPHGRRCPNSFRVQHDDRIGDLRLTEGNYRITLLAKRRPNCSKAAKLFASFLEDFGGDLPAPWRVNSATATFSKKPGVGFRVKLVR
jgi:hypothetical protein